MPLVFAAVTDPVASGFVGSLAHPGSNITESESAASLLARGPNGAVVVLPSSFINVNRHLLIALLSRHRLLAIYPFRAYSSSGGLVSNGPVFANFFGAQHLRRSDSEGGETRGPACPAPNKFELLINIKTVKTLGLTVPPTLLAPADEVIE
jgi:putative ABC transport system substrate-binding protein